MEGRSRVRVPEAPEIFSFLSCGASMTMTVLLSRNAQYHYGLKCAFGAHMSSTITLPAGVIRNCGNCNEAGRTISSAIIEPTCPGANFCKRGRGYCDSRGETLASGRRGPDGREAIRPSAETRWLAPAGRGYAAESVGLGAAVVAADAAALEARLPQPRLLPQRVFLPS